MNQKAEKRDEMSQPVPKLKNYRNFNEAADSVLRLMSQFIHMNTLFIAKNNDETNKIIKVYNRKDMLLAENEEMPFRETLCRLSVNKGREILMIPNLLENEQTKELPVAKKLGGGSFIGIPIYYDNGKNYGTICGLDQHEFEFTQKHIELFTTIASLLTFVLELEQAHKEIQNLSAPIVPITKGVAILPLIGVINHERADIITEMALTASEKKGLSYLVLDLSGIVEIDDSIGSYIEKLVLMLRLIGTTPVLTGIRPDLAIAITEMTLSQFDGLIVESTLERALLRIGLTVTQQS